VFLILHLFFFFPLLGLYVLSTDNTVKQLDFLSRPPKCFKHLIIDTALLFYVPSGLSHEHRWKLLTEIQVFNTNRQDSSVSLAKLT
jgi:hypothetical protein